MQRVLVIASTLDLLIPSQSEAEELPKLLPHCRTRLLQNRSHAVLQVGFIHCVCFLYCLVLTNFCFLGQLLGCIMEKMIS